MKDKHEQHLMKLKIQSAVLMDEKYRKGAEEHGGFLGDMTPEDLISNAIDEAIDQLVYLLTLRDKFDGTQ